MNIALSDKSELDCIAANLHGDIEEGLYSLNEAVFEVLPFDFNLMSYEQDYIRERLEVAFGYKATE